MPPACATAAPRRAAPRLASQLDLVAVCGYKFVGICVALLAHLVCWRGPSWGKTAYYVVLAYTTGATFWFAMNSLMPMLRPDLAAGRGRGGGGDELTRAAVAQRNYLAIAAALVQCLVLWWLTYVSAA